MVLAIMAQTAMAQFGDELNLVDLNGTNGFTINGVNTEDYSGRSVSSAGDVNGDGIDDIIIGAFGGDPNGNLHAGNSYVVFGSEAGFPSTLELSTLDGSNGFTINGVSASDSSGRSVSNAGDVNGDGIDDVIIGAHLADPNNKNGAGSSYVVFGNDSGFPSTLELSTLDGNNGFTINGEDNDDYSGRSVSHAGDVNGDGIDDVIIGAYFASPNGIEAAGSSYVVFGSDSGFPSNLELSTLDGSNGFTINGVNASDYSGFSVSYAGDVNGDGVDDVIIGAYRAYPNGNSRAGRSFVVFGNTVFPSTLQLSSLDGSNGLAINGVNVFDFSGGSVSHAGDVNGDGIEDVIIGASGADPNGNLNAGSSYVVFGNGAGFPSTLELSALGGSDGFIINGVNADDASGYSVSYAGDVNGDGVDDMIIGADLADPNGNSDAGSSYVVYGNDAGFPNPLNLADLDGSNGFTINGVNANDFSGRTVSHAGDVNGDGIDDLIIGAVGGDPNANSEAGSSYVVFGRTEVIFQTGFE